LVLVRSFPEEVDVQLKSFSSLTPAPDKLDITANIDLSAVHEGQATVRIKNTDFSLPSGMIVSTVTPSSIKVVTEKKVRKTVPVRVVLKGGLAAGLGGYEAVSRPRTVEVEGPAGQVSRVESVATEEIDAGRLAKGKEYQNNLILPPQKVTLLQDEPVVIKVVPRHKKR
jgi:YbbR domain-containing protein